MLQTDGRTNERDGQTAKFTGHSLARASKIVTKVVLSNKIWTKQKSAENKFHLRKKMNQSPYLLLSINYHYNKIVPSLSSLDL